MKQAALSNMNMDVKTVKIGIAPIEITRGKTRKVTRSLAVLEIMLLALKCASSVEKARIVEKRGLEMSENKPKKPWWETAKEWVCQECGTINPMTSDVCSGCDCSLDGFVDDEWLYKSEEEE